MPNYARNYVNSHGQSMSSQSQNDNRSLMKTAGRMNPWEGGMAPGAGNNFPAVNTNTVGNLNLGNIRNPNIGHHSASNANVRNPNVVNSNIRHSGGLLPTPNLPTSGLLPSPVMPHVQLSVPGSVLNLLMQPQQNQSLHYNRSSLLPLNPSNHQYMNQAFGSPSGPQGTNRRLGPDRIQQLSDQRGETYKMSSWYQRSGKNDSNGGHRSGSSPSQKSNEAQKTEIEQAKYKKEVKQKDSRNDPNSREICVESITKKESKRDVDLETFKDVPPRLLTCHLCSKNMWDATSFVNHVKGKAHRCMLEKREETYKRKIEQMRELVKVDEQQREHATQMNKRQVGPQSDIFCPMCNLHFFGNMTGHRKSYKHQQLKSFLHPTCKDCKKEFATRIDWDQHLLSPGHLKVIASKSVRQSDEGNSNKRACQAENTPLIKRLKQNEEACHSESKDHTVENKPDMEKCEAKEAALESGKEKESVSPVIASPKIVSAVEDPLKKVTPIVIELTIDPENIPKYDSQKELGMEMLQEKTGFLCRCCNRFLNSSADSKTHCRSQFHYEKYVTYIKSKMIQTIKASKIKEKEVLLPSSEKEYKSPGSSVDQRPPSSSPNDQTLTNKDDKKLPTDIMKHHLKKEVDEEDEDEEEDESGNWKRKKVSETSENNHFLKNPALVPEEPNCGNIESKESRETINT